MPMNNHDFNQVDAVMESHDMSLPPLFRLNGAVRHQPAIDEWLSGDPPGLFAIARHWFGRIRLCGPDVQEVMHDGCATACVQDVAFVYVNVFAAHVAVGFYYGALLDDPARLLAGTGKRMRHVKIKAGAEPAADALQALIEQAYRQVHTRLAQTQQSN